MAKGGWRMGSKRITQIALIACVALGLFLRFYGIRWGAPERVDLHPDEFDYVIKHALELNRHNLDPHFLNYPSFMMYLTAGCSWLLRLVGVVSEEWHVYIVGRSVSALFGTATILVVYLLCRALGGGLLAACLAALWMALLPLNIWDSHVAITDVLMTFWVSVTLLLSLRIMRLGRIRDFILGGVALGLATGSKYTAAISAVAIVIGGLLSRLPPRRILVGLVGAGLVSVLCCFLVTPYSFIRIHEVLNAMAYESAHTHGHHYGFSIPAVGAQYHRYIYQLFAAWPFSLGFALYGCALAGVVWMAFHFNKRMLVPLGFFVVFFGITGSWYFVPLRYYEPLLVVLVVMVGLWQGAWLTHPDATRRRVAQVAIAVTLVYTALFAFQTAARYACDTRIEAARWIEQTLKPGERLILSGWHRYMAEPLPAFGIKQIHRFEHYVGRYPANRAEEAELVEISALHYQRAYREGQGRLLEIYRQARAPNPHLLLVKRFESSFINRDIYERLDPMFACYFVSPDLEFYRPTPASTPAPAKPAGT